MAALSESSSLDYISLHPFVRSTVLDKVRGTIFGSALGDAVGLYTEFLNKQQALESYSEQRISLAHPVTPFKGDRHRDKFVEGSWTDDTDHALLVLLSYLHHDGQLVPHDFALRLRSWCEQGLRCLDRLPLGLGRTVGTVINHQLYRDAPVQAAKKLWVASDRTNAANGSLMRTHPLGVICVGNTRTMTYQTAMDYSLVTHTDPRCVVSCCISTALTRGILRGEVTTESGVEEIIEDAYAWVSSHPKAAETWDSSELQPLLDRGEFERHAYASSLDELQLDDSRTMGYVYKALGAALVTLRKAIHMPTTKPDAFGGLIEELVMQGGDADTNACIAGALLGCWTGFNSLTSQWRDGLAHSEWLLEKVDGLCQTVGIVPGEYKGSLDPHTAFDGGRGLLGEDELRAREKQLMEKILLNMKARDDERKGNEKRNAGSGRKGWDKLFKR
ncbi:ADP-ribosylglycohydrolase-domain-containing protein [Sphaerosporella brunnea]|uniref:ADP-ribosylglycohydrolase-domain-containing protein n=1 Tax=Sphaerosporella brunnea TaxID=1250544 RepID=A0A5J5F6V1_9PEZI|nr:ADP-ribosylglycohydrolase-domain-containing protein [Sphaerosporella brunnea]